MPTDDTATCDYGGGRNGRPSPKSRWRCVSQGANVRLLKSRTGGLFPASRWRQLQAVCGLSPRQTQVARLVCEACENKRIALRLKLSLDTVRMHLKELFRKLDVETRVALVLKLVQVDRALGTVRRNQKRRGDVSETESV